MDIRIPELRVEEAELLASINKLNKYKPINFDELNKKYHIELFGVRSKLLAIYYSKLPIIPNPEISFHPNIEYQIYEAYLNYLTRYRDMFNKHPVFYNLSSEDDINKIILEINQLGEKIDSINMHLTKLKHN
jgi:hypothetical protein